MKAIWNGTDSLFLVKFPKQLKRTKIFYVFSLRVFARLCDIFAYEHYYLGPLVYRNLCKFGMKKPLILYKSPILDIDIKLESHSGFNVLYYYPKKDTKFNRWLYGFDIYEGLLNEGFNFIVVDGSHDMNKIYPVIDVLIRPNRHDGDPRMVRECNKIGIPVIHTYENPSILQFKESLYGIKYICDSSKL